MDKIDLRNGMWVWSIACNSTSTEIVLATRPNWTFFVMALGEFLLELDRLFAKAPFFFTFYPWASKLIVKVYDTEQVVRRIPVSKEEATQLNDILGILVEDET